MVYLLCLSTEIRVDTLHTTPYVNVTWLNGNTIAVNREVVYLSEHTYQVRLRGFLKSEKGCRLKSQRPLGIQTVHDLTDKPLEWSFSN